MSGSKTQTQTQSATSEPWEAAQPVLERALWDAENLYERGIGFKPYTGSTVVPYANQTIKGANAIENIATATQPAFDQNFVNTATMLGQGGLTDLQRQAVDYLQPMARGDMLTQNNPFTDAVVNRAADRMGSQISLLASGMGRTGSGAHQGVLAREVGDMASKAYMQDYDKERGYMQDAIGSLFNAGQQQFSNTMQGAKSLTDAYNAMLTPATSLMDVGSLYEDLNTRLMNDQLRIFNETQRAPLAAVEWLNAIGTGAGALGGTQYGDRVAQGPSRLGAGLGGALGGATLFGLPGAILGGLGGALL